MAAIGDNSGKLNQIQNLNQQISQFKTDATGKKAPADQLKATAAALASQVDTMQAAGVISYSQAQELSTNLTAMGDIAGRSGNSSKWNDLSGDVGAMMNSLTSGGEASLEVRLNLNEPAAQGQLTQMMGAGLTGGAYNDFNKFLSSMGIRVSQDGGGNAAGFLGVKNGDQLAGALNQRNMQVYSDSSGNTVLYNSETRKGAAFTADGTTIPVPSEFTSGGLEQKSSYSFNVGGMTIKYGEQKDSKGNAYGLDIANT